MVTCNKCFRFDPDGGAAKKGAIDAVRLQDDVASETADGDMGVGGTLLRKIVSFCCVLATSS